MFLSKKALLLFKNIHFQSLFGNGVLAIFGMLTFSVLYRALSITDIGIYVFLMTMLGLIDTLKSGFLTVAFIKFYSGTKTERANEVAGSTWALAIVVSCMLLAANIITYFFALSISNISLVLFLKYFSIISLSSLPAFMANLMVQGDKRFDRLLWLRLINQVSFTGSVIGLIFLKQATLNSVLLAYVITNLTTSVVITLIGWANISSLKYAAKNTFWEIFHFGKYSVGTSLSANLFAVTDTFFINFFLGPAFLAVYNLGGKLLQIVEMPLLSFAASGMPGLSAFYNIGDKESMMHLMKKMVGMLSVVVLVFAAICIIFAEPIIGLLGGSKYIHSEAPNLFRVFIAIAVLYPADRFFALTLDVIHKPKINFYKIIVMLVLNLLADYIGLAVFGSIYLVAFANIFPEVAAVLIAYIPLNKYYKFSFWEVFPIGFNEIVSTAKTAYANLFVKNQPVNN